MINGDYVTTAEAAKILGCHRHTVNDNIHRGLISAIRKSRNEWLVDKGSVLKFKAERELQGLKYRKEGNN